MIYTKLASAIYNDIMSGLRGYSANPTISLEQLEDDIVDERLAIIKEFILKGILPKNDLYVSINCIQIDCESLDRCNCGNQPIDPELVKHFELPQVMLDFGVDSISYIGSTDRLNSFIIYTTNQFQTYHNNRKRGKDKPYVYIDTTPNKNNMIDGFIFNAPLLKQISAVIIPKDQRQLEQYACCDFEMIDNISFINNEIKRRLTEKKVRYYRQLAAPLTPNDQIPK